MEDQMQFFKDLVKIWGDLGAFLIPVIKFFISPFYLAWATCWILYLFPPEKFPVNMETACYLGVSILLYRWTCAPHKRIRRK
tara:strand:- start:690 stop:935 length:246 start_codon:yes stop_codon:yes gene_type:complete